MTAVLWEIPPNRRTIKVVDAGVVVLVRFWPTSAASILIEDTNGVPPHVVFRANLAPQGTTAFQHFAIDPVMGGIYPVPGSIGERPTTLIDGLLTPDNTQVDFDLDAGQAFLCPYPGEIQLIGGRFAAEVGDGPVAPYNTSVQVVMPQEVSLEYADIVACDGALFRRRLHRATGWRPRRRPTMTYFNVPNGVAAPVQVPVPRGATGVQVGDTATVLFVPGNLEAAAETVTLSPGAPMPIGFFSQGSFRSGGAGSIPWISFEVEL